MTLMKKWMCLLAALLMLCACAASEEDGDEDTETSGSWSQINQSLEKGDGWQRIITDPTAFQLGKISPRDSSSRLFTQTVDPSRDG